MFTIVSYKISILNLFNVTENEVLSKFFIFSYANVFEKLKRFEGLSKNPTVISLKSKMVFGFSIAIERLIKKFKNFTVYSLRWIEFSFSFLYVCFFRKFRLFFQNYPWMFFFFMILLVRRTHRTNWSNEI